MSFGGKFNKKTAARFNLIHRSQQDPLYHAEGGSQAVLHPADQQTAANLHRLPFSKQLGATNYVLRELREVDDKGFILDGYDYEKHLRPIGEGTFMNSSGVVEKVPEALLTTRTPGGAKHGTDNAVGLPSEVLASETELPRMLEAITLRPDLMDEDMRRILEDDDAEAEDLDDDFMAQIISAKDDSGENESGEPGFDFDAHVERLMQQAAKEDEEEQYEEEDEEEGKNHFPPRPQRDVDAHFEAVMAAEYNDDDEEEDGGDDEEDEVNGEEASQTQREFQAGGPLEAANDIVVEAMNDYLRQRAEDRTVGNVANPPSKHLILASTGHLQEQLDAEQVEEPVAEGDVLEAWGTYKYTPKPQFDCATIITTLSTLDNHPAMIEVPGRALRGTPRRRKESHASSVTEELALEVAKLTMHAIAERVKDESAEDKRARKQAVKEVCYFSHPN